MIQFSVNGRFLELPDNLTIQFVKKNVLFAFDEIECERTASFSVPDTPNNDAIFGVSKIIAGMGAGMRVRYDAHMIDGAVTKNGYLYVDEYDKKQYTCVFVCGDLIELKKAKDAGNIRNLFTTSTMTETATYDKVPMYSTSGAFVTSVYRNGDSEYDKHEDGNMYPAINLAYLIQKCCTRLQIGAPEPVVSNTYGIFLVPAELLNTNGEPAAVGSTVRLIDNLPELTFVELVKTYAAISGKLPNMTGNRLTFEDMSDIDEWTQVPLDGKVISMGNMRRTFSNYAQRNTVSGEERETKAVYTIDNQNLQKDSKLQTVPFDLGTITSIEPEGALYTKQVLFIGNGKWGIGKKDETLPIVVTEDQYFKMCLEPIDAEFVKTTRDYYYVRLTGALPKNEGVENLCEQSTSVTARVRMSALEYERIKAKTTFVYRNTRYVWTEAQYGNGVATIKMSKI